MNVSGRKVLGLLLIGVSAAVGYFSTLAPVVQGFDSAELTVGAYHLGFVHAPGYPVYMLLGYLFIHMLPGDAGRLMNALSACLGVLAVLALYGVLWFQFRRWWVASLGAILFAATPAFWSQAIRAEVYTFHVLLVAVALMMWFVARERRNATWYLISWGILGVGLAHHPTILLLWVSMFVVAVGFETRWRWLTIVGALLGCSIAGLGYLYFPLRSLSALEVDYLRTYFGVGLNNLQDLWWLVSARAFHQAFYVDLSPSAIGRESLGLLSAVMNNSMGIGLVLGAWGWHHAQNRFPEWNRLLTAYALSHVAAFYLYHVVDKSLMIIPLYLVISIWAAYGMIALANWVQTRARAKRALSVQRLVALLLLIVILLGALVNYPSLTLDDNRRVYSFAKSILQGLAPGTVVVNHWVTASVFDYLVLVEGVRPDVTSFNLDFHFLALADRYGRDNRYAIRQQWFAWLEDHDHSTLCFIEPLPAIPRHLRWVASGDCWVTGERMGRWSR